MSLLTSILDAVLNHPSVQQERQQNTVTTTNQSAAPDPRTTSAPTTASTSTAPAPPPNVDVASILDQMAKKSGEDLDWRHSIVDLLKAIGHDSSHSARLQLAQELHYDGDTSDSATTNQFLHKAVLQALEDNGGKLPDDLK